MKDLIKAFGWVTFKILKITFFILLAVVPLCILGELCGTYDWLFPLIIFAIVGLFFVLAFFLAVLTKFDEYTGGIISYMINS